jgi:uncharacterized protein YdhG (YjbR/CyaY superfamily)
MATKFETVDEYIATFPSEVREVLEMVRRTIHTAVPDAGEKISYQIPTVTVGGKPVVYFSGWKEHISLYPIPDLDESMTERVEPFRSGKGTVKFPLGQPIPYDLVADLARKLTEQRS